MRVRLTRAAQADLVEIGLNIATDNRLAAHLWVSRLRARCRSLGKFPDRFVVAFWTQPPIRRLSEGAYNVFYTVGADAVTVRRILHGARDVDPEMIGPL